MYAFGLSNNSPDQAVGTLLSKNVIEDASEIAVLPSGTRLKENKKPVRNVIFCLSVTDFNRNLEVLNSARYAMVRVFIFASPLRIREMQNVVALDFDVNPAASGLGFLMRKDLNMPLYKKTIKTAQAEQVSRVAAHYLNTLTDNVKRGSLLNPLMTFIYTLPSSTHQTPVKEAIAKFLYKSLPYSRLEIMLDEIRGVTVNKRVRDRLKEILTSEVGENYRAAFKAMGALPEDKDRIETICKQFHTSDYEMKYIESIVKTSGLPKKVKTKATVH